MPDRITKQTPMKCEKKTIVDYRMLRAHLLRAGAECRHVEWNEEKLEATCDGGRVRYRVERPCGERLRGRVTLLEHQGSSTEAAIARALADRNNRALGKSAGTRTLRCELERSRERSYRAVPGAQAP